MLVRDRMSKIPITTNPSATVPDALQVMRGSKVRQLPVVNEKGELVGIVALGRPSPRVPVTGDVAERLGARLPLEKITVEKVMTREVITVTEDMAMKKPGASWPTTRSAGCR